MVDIKKAIKYYVIIKITFLESMFFAYLIYMFIQLQIMVIDYQNRNASQNTDLAIMLLVTLMSIFLMINHFRIRYLSFKIKALEKKKPSSRSLKSKFITAFDPKIKRHVLHTVNKGIATSTVTKNKFKYNQELEK